MCKKVAQLTRVIFYLNTKNDQYQSNLKAVVNAYENELDNTVKEVKIALLRQITSYKSTKMLQTKPIKMANLKIKLRRSKTIWKGKRKNRINNLKNIKRPASSERPNRLLKLQENYVSTKIKYNRQEEESRPQEELQNKSLVSFKGKGKAMKNQSTI